MFCFRFFFSYSFFSFCSQMFNVDLGVYLLFVLFLFFNNYYSLSVISIFTMFINFLFFINYSTIYLINFFFEFFFHSLFETLRILSRQKKCIRFFKSILLFCSVFCCCGSESFVDEMWFLICLVWKIIV